MRVEFEIYSGDFSRYTRALPLLQRWRRFRSALRTLAMLCLPGAVLLSIWGTVGGLIAAGMGMLAICLLFWWLQRRAERRLVAVLQRMAIELKPDCLRAETEYGWTERDWSGVRQVYESAECWLMTIGEGHYYAVPKAAFASAAEGERFAAELRRLVAAGARSAVPRLAPQAPNLALIQQAGDVATQVSFVTTAVQFHDANQYAASPNAKPLTTGAAVRSILLSAGSGIAIMFVERGIEPNLMIQFAVFMLLMLAVLTLLRLWARTRWEKFAEPTLLGPRALTLTREGLWWTGPDWQSYSRWEMIGRAQQVGDLLAIYSIQPQAVAVIPVSAFSSELEAEAFLETVTMFQGMAEHRRQAQDLPMLTVVSDNPYQPPSTM